MVEGIAFYAHQVTLGKQYISSNIKKNAFSVRTVLKSSFGYKKVLQKLSRKISDLAILLNKW